LGKKEQKSIQYFLKSGAPFFFLSLFFYMPKIVPIAPVF